MRSLRDSVLLIAVLAVLLAGPSMEAAHAAAPTGTLHLAPVGCTTGASSVPTVSFSGSVTGLVPSGAYVVWLALTDPTAFPLAARQGAERWLSATAQGGLTFDYPDFAGTNTTTGWPVGVSYTMSVSPASANGSVGNSVLAVRAQLASCPPAPPVPPGPAPPQPVAPKPVAPKPVAPKPAAPVLRQSGNNSDALYQKCAAVMFVGVRGSGQLSSDGNGYGNEVWYVRNGVLAEIPAATAFREVFVDYEAQGIKTLFVSPPGPDNTFFASVHQGQTLLEQVLNDSIARCPNEKWILAGYSQGAMVINRVVRNYTLDDRIVGIGLIADPARRPDQVGVQVGTASPGWGIALASSPLPAVFDKPSTISVCDDNDAVCDFPAGIGGIGVHTSYASKQPLLLVNVGKALVARSGLPTKSSLNTTGATAIASFAASAMSAGQSASVELQGLPPGSPVTIVIHSQTIDMGSVNATPEGTLDYTFTPPSGLSAGAHEIVFVTGYGNVSVPFTLVPAPTSSQTAAPMPSPSATCGKEGQRDPSAQCLVASGARTQPAASKPSAWGPGLIAGVAMACSALLLGIAFRRRRNRR